MKLPLGKVSPGSGPSAGPGPLGDEILASISGGPEIKLDDGTWSLVTAPLIILLTGGGYAVIWSNKVAADGVETIIEARVYDADGVAIGQAFRVNTSIHSGTPDISAAATRDGGFVVSWVDDSEGVEPAFGYTDPSNILAQAFGPDGTARGPELMVNSGTTGLQDNCQVVGLPGGGFAVVWVDYSADADRTDPWGTAVSDIRVQLFGADRAPVGSSFLVNTVIEGSQYAPQITALADGTLVVIWSDYSGVGADTSGSAVKGRLLSSGGEPIGNEFLVNTTTTDVQNQPEVTTLAGGGFVVTWINGQSSSAREVRAQVFEADGSPVGGEINVNTATVGAQQYTDTLALANGGFVIVWQDRSKGVGGAQGDNSESAIKAQVFSPHGTAIGFEILVNTATLSHQQVPRIAALADGGFVITWQDMSGDAARTGPDTEFNAVKAQVFTGAGFRIGDELLVNVTTAGDQSGPQVIGNADGRFTITWSDSSAGSYQPMMRSFEVAGDVVHGTAGDDTLTGTRLGDTFQGSAGNDVINGGEGRDILVLSGVAADYRLLANGDGFILKGPDGRDTLTSVEVIHFSDGRVLELDRLYERDPGSDGMIPDHLLSPGPDAPQVLPGPADKAGDGDAFVLPAVPDDQPWVLPDTGSDKYADAPLVLPGVLAKNEAVTSLFSAVELHLPFALDWAGTIDPTGGPVNPTDRDIDWFG